MEGECPHCALLQRGHRVLYHDRTQYLVAHHRQITLYSITASLVVPR